MQQQQQQKSSILRALWATYRDFAANTGVHGLKYVSEDGRRIWERLLWIVVVLGGLVGAGFMTATFWQRFKTSPTRASVETNHFPVWRLPFPAATFCNFNRIFRSRAERLLDRLGAEGQEREEAWKALPMLMELMQSQPSNSTYRPGPANTMQKLLDRNKMTLIEAMENLDQSCLDMVERCKWEGEIVNCEDIFEERKTYLGMCCSFNYRGVIETTDSKGKKNLVMAPGEPRHSRFFSHRMGLSVLLNPMKNDNYLSVLYSTAIGMTVHRVDDYPDEAAEEKILPMERELLVAVTASSTYCTKDVRNLSPVARECMFPDERQLRFFPVYSSTNCLTECRMNFSVKFCGCSPFYYLEVDDIPICTLKDIPCLNKFYYALRRQRSSMGKLMEDSEATTVSKNAPGLEASLDCSCPPLCNQVDYEVQVSSGDFKASRFQQSKLLQDANVTGRILVHFYQSSSVTVRTKRDVVSSWSDLFSSLGGVFSLCLGCSIMSVIEVVYYFTMRLAFRYRYLAAHPDTLGDKADHDGAGHQERGGGVQNMSKFPEIPISQRITQTYPTRINAWVPSYNPGASLWKNQY